MTQRLASKVILGIAALGTFLIFEITSVSMLRAQSISSAKPNFEVASVKRCDADSMPPPVPGGRGGGSPPPQWSPGRLTVTCQPVRIFVAWAYADYADGQDRSDRVFGDIFSTFNTPVEGLPSWGNSERFTISAEGPGDAGKEMMMGPMMQSLLEDRFQLKLHVIDKKIPAYDLVVAKGGPKLPQNGKSICRGMLQPKSDAPGPPIPEPGNGPRCTMQFNGVSMANLARLIEGPIGTGRPVIDKTGITGQYQVRMLWSVDMSQTGAPPPDTTTDSDLPTIFDALKEQLGLELVTAEGTAKRIVIDHIEEPSAN